MALPGKAPKSAAFGKFHSPILAFRFRPVFERVVALGEELSPPSKGCRVLKTEELGTAGYQPYVPWKRWKSVFVNYVRKPVSRLDRV